MFEVQQAGHQANRQLGTSGVAATRAHQGLRGAEQVLTFEDLACAMLSLKLCRHCRFYFDPRAADLPAPPRGRSS